MRICGVPHDHGVLYFKILIINIQDNEKCKLLISQKKNQTSLLQFIDL